MLETIPNQPVAFDIEDVACSSVSFLYTQPVNVGDITQFQVAISPCVETPINDDPEFDDSGSWTIGTNWSVINGEACKTIGGISSISQSNVFSSGKYYKIVVQVNSYIGSIFVGDGAQTFGTIYQTGENIFYGFPTTDTINMLGLINASICVESIKVFEMPTNHIVSIRDVSGNTVEVINPQDDPDLFDYADDRLTIFIDWDTFAVDGTCYYICLTEPCTSTNGQNGLFNESFELKGAGWDLPGNILADLSADTKQLVFNSTGAASRTATNEATQLKDGLSYQITFTVVSITAGNVRIVIGSNLGTSRTTAGTFTETVVADGTDFGLRFQHTGAANIVVDNVIVRLANDDDIVCDFVSNNFKYGNTACTLLIQACSDVNALDFNFENFKPAIRIIGKLVKAQYPSERTTVTNNNGIKRVAFFDGRKNKEFRIGVHPEYVHDFLRTLPGYNQVFIDAQEFIVSDDEYEVNYEDDAEDFGTATVIVEEKAQIARFSSCGSEVIGQCSIDDLFLVLSQDPEIPITTESGEQLIVQR